MNKVEQRLAIAKSVGWRRREGGMWYCPDGSTLPEDQIPDYLNDLNAMHELERNMTDADFFRYSLQIESMAKILGPTGRWITDNQRILYSTTAAQRAEAYLRTIGKWKD